MFRIKAVDHLNQLQKNIVKLKKEKGAVILSHYYTLPEIQEISDYVGDSFYLSKIASEVSENIIVLCGVSFMGESAKIINPDKTIILPDPQADCPMAHMVTPDKIRSVREQYDDLAVVCYINSTAEIKACSDVCVTSSNALKIVEKLPQKNIFFIPDEHLGRFISKRLPEKNFIFNDGYCHVHADITTELINQAKKEHPSAKVLMHPECHLECLKLSDYTGSTSEIINYAKNSSHNEFIVCTEQGILFELTRQCPDKIFYFVNEKQICPEMKKITLEKLYETLKAGKNNVFIDNSVYKKSSSALQKMLSLAE